MKEKGPPLWTKNFCVLILVLFANSFCFQMFNATLALYVQSIVGEEGSVGTVSGIATMIFTVAIIIARLVGGDLVDRWGRRPLITAGAVILAVGALCNAFIPTVAALFVLRVIQGIGAGMASVGGNVSMVQIVPEERLTEGLGKANIGITFATIFGPTIALSLIAGGDFRLPFFAVAISCCLSITGTWIIHTKFDDRHLHSKANSGSEQTGMARFSLKNLVEKRALLPSFIQMLCMFSFASYSTYLTIYAGVRGFSQVGTFFAIGAVVTVVVQFLTGKLGDRYSPVFVAIPGMLLSLLSFILMTVARSQVAFLATALVYGLGNGMITPVMSATTIRGVPENRKSAATATFYVMFDVGLGLGGLFWGIIADIIGVEYIYIGACFTIGAAALLMFLMYRGKRPPERAES